MTAFRALLFNAFFLAWTTLLACLFLLLLPFPWRVLSTSVAWWARSVLWVLKVLVGLEFEVRGLEHRPQGAAIVAAKHQSAWDTIAINVLLDHPVVVLKRELLQLPVWGWLAKHCGMIGVDRSSGTAALRAMVAAAQDRAAQGRQIVIFPQGTRTAPGTRRGYYPGVVALYDRLHLPVVPVALNSGVFWGRRAFMKKPGMIVVEFLPAIAPGLSRRQFLGELESRIETVSDRLATEAGFDASGLPQ